MKKVSFILCICLLTCVTVSAQTNTFPSSGNVGIGTQSPEKLLHIQGSGTRIVSGSGWGGEIVPTGYHQTLSLTTNLYYTGSGSPEQNMRYLKGPGVHASGGALLYLRSNNNTGRGFYFYTADESTGVDADAILTERLRIRHNGTATFMNTSVGIGTISPSAKLAVNGDIKTKEIIVTKQSTDWPDYVFEAGYHLQDLTELESYINEHNHLPGIPTKKDIEQNGQSLGAIQGKLLKKIEELTLYVIEQQKQIKKLQQQLKSGND